MRFKTFYRRVIESESVESLPFTKEHFHYKGISFASIGMSILEAYELVNEWNKSGNERYVYWL